jgi:hypothetical protein
MVVTFLWTRCARGTGRLKEISTITESSFMHIELEEHAMTLTRLDLRGLLLRTIGSLTGDGRGSSCPLDGRIRSPGGRIRSE